LPCLNQLLNEENIEQKLRKYAPAAAAKIRSKQDIVENIFDILTGNSFALFRVNAVKILKNGAMFNQRLPHLRFLDKKNKEIISDLIKSIEESEPVFMTELQKIVKSSSKEVHENCQQLIEYLINCLAHKCHNSKHNTYAGNGYEHGHEHEHCEGIKGFIEHGIEEIQHEFQDVKKLLFSVVHSASAAIGQLDDLLTNSKKRAAPEEPVAPKDSHKKLHLS
jgi:hypothetical protein